MRTDELRSMLTEAAGDVVDVDGPYRAVARRARRGRRRTRAALTAAVVAVLAASTVAAVAASRGGGHDLSVRTGPAGSGIADLAWTRVASPPIGFVRITTAAGQTFALGSAHHSAVIDRLDAGGAVTEVFRSPAGASDPRGAPAVFDLAEGGGALVAAGQAPDAPGGRIEPAAWRSADGGRTWVPVAVDPPADTGALTSLTRVVRAGGEFYVFGTTYSGTAQLDFAASVWTSSDGTHFRRSPVRVPGGGAVDAANGPAGPLLTTSVDASAWTLGPGGEWQRHEVSAEPNAHVFAVAADSRGYAAVGTTGRAPRDLEGAIWWSADGQHWARVATDLAPGNPDDRQAELTAVAHSPAGWIATGWQLHPGGDPARTDAILWTSPDGTHWTEDTRDAGTFEQDAFASGVGATGSGFAIFGSANLTGTGSALDPIRQDDVLWLGASTSADDNGIVEGTLREVGGPAPGIDRGVPGTLTLAPTGTGITTTATAGDAGRFSVTVAPGAYRVTGHSPAFGNGAYDCEAGGEIDVTAHTVTHATVVCSLR